MKRSLVLILVCLLSLCLPLALTACDNTDTDPNSSGSDISTENSVPEPTDPIVVENGLAVYIPDDAPLKIAQFADLHFGVEGNSYHNDKIARTKKYMQYIVETEKPDLIVCTGDNIMSTGVEKLAEFVEFMDTLKTPWAFAYGNHDAENNSAG